MGGQIRMRVRFGKIVGEWFDYLLVSPEEMEKIIAVSRWQIKKFIESEQAQYFAIINKK
jgi:hypothetical protein